MCARRFTLSEEFFHPSILDPGVRPPGKTGSWRYMRPVRKEKIAPCSDACPAGVRVPEYMELVNQGKLREAWELILENNPMPAVTGRVCYSSCEKACSRGPFDEPVAIQSVERFIGDYGLELPADQPQSPCRKERIAVIGSGPAGLTCAYYLARRGYGVSVFEALPSAGGMLYAGIPGYRLPRKILEAEINRIRQAGVTIQTNTGIGGDLTLDNLVEQGYAAIFIATGAHRGVKLGVEGEDLPGVMDGVAFLRKVNLGEKVEVGESVVVIGGGNAAVDSARSALRLGAGNVKIVYRRTLAEMPAFREEVNAALEEKIEIVFLAAPVRISGVQGKLEVTCARMELGESDATGRRTPVPLNGDEFTLDCDTVITATGQVPEIPSGMEILARRGNLIQADSETLATSLRGVWAGGDAVSGPDSVVRAIAAGRKAADCIEKALTGEDSITRERGQVSKPEEINSAYFCRAPRSKNGRLSPEQRAGGFAEINLGLGRDAAFAEASRCFHCGTCNLCGNCWFFCPDGVCLEAQGRMEADLDYCKGCGVCVEECPRGVLVMEVESKWNP